MENEHGSNASNAGKRVMAFGLELAILIVLMSLIMALFSLFGQVINMPIGFDYEERAEIAKLLTHRCNNCYQRLPGGIGCNVNSEGWNWATENFGPFCDGCWNELLIWKEKNANTIR